MISNKYLEASLKLYSYIYKTHWDGVGVVGPDQGVRFNIRIGRFIKSYFPFFSWNDNQYFLQGQGYWISDNWLLFDLLGEEKYRKIALDCSQGILARQKSEGYWDYPNPEWKSRIATVEGCFAALGLIESYKKNSDYKFLKGALKWYNFLINKVGFEKYKDSLVINYFANKKTPLVPNNTTLVLMLLSELFDATKEKKYLIYFEKMVKFLQYAQLENGELPYSIDSISCKGKAHYLCYQYNSFEFLDLARVYEITKNQTIYSIMTKLLDFLSTGITDFGSAKYNCFQNYPIVNYYTAVMGAAFLIGRKMGLGYFNSSENKIYQCLLSQQKQSGSFICSKRDYFIFSDKRSYPRQLSMILKHLLLKAKE